MPENTVTISPSGIHTRRAAASLGRDNLLGIFEILLDPCILVISLWTIAIVLEGELDPAYLILSVIVFSITFPGASRLHSTTWRTITDVFFNWIWTALLLVAVGVATRYINQFSLATIFVWLCAAPVAQIVAHQILRVVAPYLLKLQGSPQRAVIVGMNDQGAALASRLKKTRYSRCELVGYFDDRDGGRLNTSANTTFLGKLSDISTYVKEQHVQLIYLSMPMASQPRILHILEELKDTTASIYFVPDMFVTDLIQGRSGTVLGMPVISVCESPFTGSNGAIKRASDVILSLLILVLISPILLAIAIAVKVGSPGPVIFKQRRYGLDGKELLVYKFRSMTVCEDGGDLKQAQKNDARITRLGAFLRKTSLDELPQFVNVLQGRMSIVGPRPHAVAHNELYRTLIKGYMVRHKVKPGITGWAQVCGYRGETETLDKMQARIDYDLDYLRNWSLKLDLHIILKTIRVVFKDQAAY